MLKKLGFAVVALLMVATMTVAGGKWAAKGTFVEGCSCEGVCPCELTGLKDGCEGVGAVMLKNGSSYNGVDIGGTKIAYATNAGKWVRLYIDPKDPKQADAAKEFASGFFSALGKVESVKQASVDMQGDQGKYTVAVDGGNIMKFNTEPVLGLDKKTPITHTNVNNPMVPTVMQGKTVSGTYKDGDKSFTLEGTNSYFNPNVNSTGSL